MNDDNLSDVTSAPRTILPFKPREVTPKVTLDAKTPDKAIVDMLEDYLAAAKAGKVQFVAIASVDHRGVAYSTWEPDGTGAPQLITQALGAVSYLHFRFNESCAYGAEVDNSLREALKEPPKDDKDPA